MYIAPFLLAQSKLLLAAHAAAVVCLFLPIFHMSADLSEPGTV